VADHGYRFAVFIKSADKILRFVDYDNRVFRLARSNDSGWTRSEVTYGPDLREVWAVSQDGRLICCYHDGKISIKDSVSAKTVCEFAGDCQAGDLLQISPDNRYLLKFTFASFPCVVDLTTGRETPLPSAEYGTMRRACFHPTESKLAWLQLRSTHSADYSIIIYDCKTRQKTTLDIPDRGRFYSGIAWSADGNYIAYLGREQNPYNWKPHRSDLRVISVDGKRSATLKRDFGSDYNRSFLLWVR